MNPRIRIVSEETLSDNWGTLQKVRFATPDRSGAWQEHVREVYDRGNAAVILLGNVETGKVLLTRQLRIPVAYNGDEPWLIEACAGVLEGDDPETCARKEAVEETGYRPRNVRHLFDSYMSPGSVTEKLSFFFGDYRADDRVAEGGGLAEEGEDIEVLEIPFADAMRMIGREIVDAKTIMLLQHVALAGTMGTQAAIR